jgi:hypothetical protein
MHIFGYIATGFLIVCILLAATKSLSAGSPASIVIAMADVAHVVAPDAMKSSRQPTPGPILQQRNQADRALERLQDRAEEQEDLLNILD